MKEIDKQLVGAVISFVVVFILIALNLIALSAIYNGRTSKARTIEFGLLCYRAGYTNGYDAAKDKE